MLLADFYQSHYSAQLKPRSRTDYEIQLGHLEQYWADAGHATRPELSDLSVTFLDGAINWQLRRGRSRGTADKLRRVGLALWSKAAELSQAERPPRMRALHKRKAEPTAWSFEEFQQLLTGAEQLPPPRGQCRSSRISRMVGPFPLGEWFRSLLLFLYNSGVRVDTAMQAAWSWLDLTAGVMRVPPEAQKDDEGQTVTLLPSTIRALQQLQAQSTSPLVFGDWTCDRNQVQWPALTHRLRWAIVLSGLRSSPAEVARRDLFHRIRRTFATHMYAKSGNIELVKELLGHSSIEVTYAYIDKSKIGRKLQAEILDDPTPARQLRLFG